MKNRSSRLYYVGWPCMAEGWSHNSPVRWQFTVRAPSWQIARRIVSAHFIHLGCAIPPGIRLATWIPSRTVWTINKRSTEERVAEKLKEIEEFEKDPWGVAARRTSAALNVVPWICTAKTSGPKSQFDVKASMTEAHAVERWSTGDAALDDALKGGIQPGHFTKFMPGATP